MTVEIYGIAIHIHRRKPLASLLLAPDVGSIAMTVDIEEGLEVTTRDKVLFDFEKTVTISYLRNSKSSLNLFNVLYFITIKRNHPPLLLIIVRYVAVIT
jgi:hypothetical protein